MTVTIPDTLCSFLNVSFGTKMTKEKILSLVEEKLEDLKDDARNGLSAQTQQKSAPQQLSDKKKYILSGELCNFFGLYPGTMMTHQEALSRTIKYIKSNKQLIRHDDYTKFHIDERLRGILSPDLDCSFMNLKHHLQLHYKDPDSKKLLLSKLDDEEESAEQTIMDTYGRLFTFMKPVVEKVRLSDALASMLELPSGTIMGRDEASNRVISYIKFRELDVRPEGFFIKPDHTLRDILEPKLPGVEHFTFINLQAHLVKHFTKVTEEEVRADRERRKKAAEESKKQEAEIVKKQNKCEDLEDDD